MDSDAFMVAVAPLGAQDPSGSPDEGETESMFAMLVVSAMAMRENIDVVSVDEVKERARSAASDNRRLEPLSCSLSPRVTSLLRRIRVPSPLGELLNHFSGR